MLLESLASTKRNQVFNIWHCGGRNQICGENCFAPDATLRYRFLEGGPGFYFSENARNKRHQMWSLLFCTATLKCSFWPNSSHFLAWATRPLGARAILQNMEMGHPPPQSPPFPCWGNCRSSRETFSGESKFSVPFSVRGTRGSVAAAKDLLKAVGWVACNEAKHNSKY